MPSLASIAYFVSWGIYARNFNVWNINPNGLTHINYAFANIANGQLVLGDPWADTDKVFTDHGDSWNDPAGSLHGNLMQLFRFKQQNRHIKTGISVGGWTCSGEFSNIAATDESRRKFVTSSVNFMLNFGLDFVDLDWEYPVLGGLPGNSRRPEDGRNYALLLQEYKKQFALYPNRKMEVTCAISCGLVTLINYKLSEMDSYIDRYNMMCYDFTGAWVSKTDHQSNLYARESNQDSVEKAVDYAIASGATPSKIVVGLPIYGRAFAQTNGLTKSFLGGGAGTWEPGIYDYKALPLKNCLPLWEPTCQASMCYDFSSKMLVSYDTPTSLSYKFAWILQKGLGGVMFWELSADFPFDSEFSLQRMVHIWFDKHLDKSPSELCYPMSQYPNLNKLPGCSSSSKEIRVLNHVDFRKNLTTITNDPFDDTKNYRSLKFPRAHYNFTQFRVHFLMKNIDVDANEGEKILGGSEIKKLLLEDLPLPLNPNK